MAAFLLPCRVGFSQKPTLQLWAARACKRLLIQGPAPQPPRQRFRGKQAELSCYSLGRAVWKRHPVQNSVTHSCIGGQDALAAAPPPVFTNPAAVFR